LQVLLRKQVAAATKLWSLPPEFEAISRDVWSLALTLKGAIPHIDSGNGEHEKGEKAPVAANSDKDDSEGDNSDSEGSESENGDTGVADLLDRLSEDDDFDAENSPNAGGRDLCQDFHTTLVWQSCWSRAGSYDSRSFIRTF